MINIKDISTYPYRKGIIAFIFDDDYNFLLLNLKEYKDNEWNLPGGGADDGETPKQTLYRELKEELGLDEQDFKSISKSSNPLQYDFPKEIVEEKALLGIYFKGQIKKQFVLKFIGDKSKIRIQEDEVNLYKWVNYKDLNQHLLFPNQYYNAIYVIKEILPELNLG